MNKIKIPSHVAIIMDGNARWARVRGLDRVWGHRRGAETVRKIVRYCARCGVNYLSLFAFSTENWARPKDEVDALMELFIEYIDKRLPDMKENGIRFLISGNREKFPEKVKEYFMRAERETAYGKSLNLVFCVNYGGRQEIEYAAGKLAGKDEKIEDCLYLPGIPDVDLLIRTSGEQRISNFLLWKLAYSELYFTDVLWPDFTEYDMDMAFKSYRRRNRKFGKRV